MARIKLYHGSETIIKTPQYHFGTQKNDYGYGFYCTENIELASQSGVSLRMIQLYVQRQNDINKASDQTITDLTRALCCNFYEIMEIDLEE